ncbi:unnamed protein product [Ambrosiozyma monospora]|uniref:Unnamed protein product n=1 Tax=Ambrosiozyma monospora TaxID=43982 RepID=A0A9W7DBW2_AMBMO|nr:unnamed protein product [Ambrosiozyma monospora]
MLYTEDSLEEPEPDSEPDDEEELIIRFPCMPPKLTISIDEQVLSFVMTHMDGNRRYSKKLGLPFADGHSAAVLMHWLSARIVFKS